MEIPEDVQSVADRIVWGDLSMGDLKTAICNAILAERERCAKIAEETQTFDWKGGDDWAAGYVDGKDAAADRIRNAHLIWPPDEP